MKKKSIEAQAEEIMRILDATPDSPATQAQAALNQARDAGDGGMRQEYLRAAQQHIAAIDPRREPKALQRLQAQMLALQGRGGDTEIAHLTPGEMVIPAWMQTPEVMRYLETLPLSTASTRHRCASPAGVTA